MIVFMRGFRRSVRGFLSFLDRYELASGQKISKPKSSFYVSAKCPAPLPRWISSTSGFASGSLPFKYLGSLLDKGRRPYYQHVVDKVSAKLLGWKGKLLSAGGRLILTKHVLQSKPLFLFAALPPPKSVLQQLEHLFAQFLWGSSEQYSKRVWRSWERMSFPVAENGLGFRRLVDLEHSYACKLWWKWRLGEGLWATYVDMVSIEKSCVYRRLMTVDRTMLQHTHFLIRQGNSFFLTDNWTGAGSLMRQFNLLDCDDFLGLQVRDLYAHGEWDIPALSQFLPQAVTDYVRTFTFHLQSQRDDVVWEPTVTGHFSIASAYEILRPKQPIFMELPLIWSASIPLKISIFLWRMLNALLPFPEVLVTFGFQLPSKCYCCDSLDSIQHCFFHCSFAQAVWRYFNSGFWMAF